MIVERATVELSLLLWGAVLACVKHQYAAASIFQQNVTGLQVARDGFEQTVFSHHFFSKPLPQPSKIILYFQLRSPAQPDRSKVQR